MAVLSPVSVVLSSRDIGSYIAEARVGEMLVTSALYVVVLTRTLRRQPAENAFCAFQLAFFLSFLE
jgi:hypothetical protein